MPLLFVLRPGGCFAQGVVRRDRSDGTVTVQARRLTVGGRVQGVGFRWSVLSEALRRGAAGWVRNLPDGRVEVFVQGDRETVAAVASFVRSGPPGSYVSSCVETEAALDERFSSFEIRV